VRSTRLSQVCLHWHHLFLNAIASHDEQTLEGDFATNHVVASNLVITFPTMAILPHPLFSGQRTKRTARASRAQLANSFYLRKRTICSWRERLLRVGSTDPLHGAQQMGKLHLKLLHISKKIAQILSSWISGLSRHYTLSVRCLSRERANLTVQLILQNRSTSACVDRASTARTSNHYYLTGLSGNCNSVVKSAQSEYRYIHVAKKDDTNRWLGEVELMAC
jgi:hypothetical protein